jgi:hypothetical protein
MVMLRPVSPYIADTFEHIFNYTQHMATIHYENGKYHVHKELVDNAKKNDPAKDNAAKKENSTNEHIAFQQEQSTGLLPLIISFRITSATSLFNNYLSGDHPPPRA